MVYYQGRASRSSARGAGQGDIVSFACLLILEDTLFREHLSQLKITGVCMCVLECVFSIIRV